MVSGHTVETLFIQTYSWIMKRNFFFCRNCYKLQGSQDFAHASGLYLWEWDRHWNNCKVDSSLMGATSYVQFQRAGRTGRSAACKFPTFLIASFSLFHLFLFLCKFFIHFGVFQEGAFALCFKSKHFQGECVATRRGSPLLVGIKTKMRLATDHVPILYGKGNGAYFCLLVTKMICF